MNREEIYSLFKNLNVWTRGSERAPHKPLLLLYALAKCLRGEERLISFKAVDRDLKKLLIEYGPSRKSYHTEYPFWRLKNDGVWEVSSEDLVRRASNNDPKKSELLNKNISAGFTLPIYIILSRDKSLCNAIAEMILSNNFPETLHSDILDAVGLDLNQTSSSIVKRDPTFRERVLQIYEYRCAVCGSDLRIGAVNIGLEAAHIKWHQAGGPDIVNNGFCLCILHHKLFDRGAFSVSTDHKVIVSQKVNGNGILSECLLGFHNREIRNPIRPEHHPYLEFLEWHFKEVFKSPSR